jgi:insertion element IS1 protein InsB
VERATGVSRHTLASWIKKVVLSPTIAETLLPAKADDVLELDEVWSFVFRRSNKRWLWTALCRRTKQIVAAVVGDRRAETCQKLWSLIPESYRRCHTFSDFWSAYEKVFDEQTHRSVGKETGETAHMERWNNTLRQRIARYVRETLSFSKCDFWHQIVTEMFIVTYNLSCIT